MFLSPGNFIIFTVNSSIAVAGAVVAPGRTRRGQGCGGGGFGNLICFSSAGERDKGLDGVVLPMLDPPFCSHGNNY